MKQKLLFLLLINYSSFFSQESSNTSGGEAIGSNGSISYSIGQSFFISNTGLNGSVDEGVQQPIEISEILSIEEGKFISMTFTVFPNPFESIVTIENKNDFKSPLFVEIFQQNGTLIFSSEMLDKFLNVNMSNYSVGSYILKIKNNNKSIKEYKINKI